jgi:hypothetical protein
MIESAVEHGRDGIGTDGLKGFCAYLLKEDLKAYCSILGRMIPLQIGGDLQIGITSVNIVSVRVNSFLSAEQIGKLSPPVLEVVASVVEDEAKRRDDEDDPPSDPMRVEPPGIIAEPRRRSAVVSGAPESVVRASRVRSRSGQISRATSRSGLSDAKASRLGRRQKIHMCIF